MKKAIKKHIKQDRRFGFRASFRMDGDQLILFATFRILQPNIRESPQYRDYTKSEILVKVSGD